MEWIPHAPYSPNLAPMDFALFPHLKAELRGKRFADLNDLRIEVFRVVSTYKKSWFPEVFSNGCSATESVLISTENILRRCDVNVEFVTCNVVNLRRGSDSYCICFIVNLL
jgi:hypothetical protein